jgi:hypothetical protein
MPSTIDVNAFAAFIHHADWPSRPATARVARSLRTSVGLLWEPGRKRARWRRNKVEELVCARLASRAVFLGGRAPGATGPFTISASE